MKKEDIDRKYIKLAKALEDEFFEIIDEGLPSQRRVLKEGKDIEEFNNLHGQIWQAHEEELIANGLLSRETPIDWIAEFKKATSVDEKITVIAKRLGLI